MGWRFGCAAPAGIECFPAGLRLTRESTPEPDGAPQRAGEVQAMRNRDVRKPGRAGWPLFVAAIGSFLWLGATAAPARADSNFERGFEDQMGRILAYEAVNLGKAVLFQGVVHPAVHHGPSHSGYGGHGYGPGYTANPTVVYDYRRAPVHTHDYGKRPVRWNGYRDRHPGKRLGHYKQYDRRHRNDRHDYDRHHRHDRHCRH